MKKILLTAATATTLALNSSAAFAAAETFYLKANVGWDKLNEVKVGTIKSKSNNDVFLGAGAGYYLMDNVRAELSFDHYLQPEFKGSDKATSSKLKARADSLLVNGFVDLFDASVAKIFLGAGVGMSMVSAKATLTTTGVGINETVSNKYKQKNNLAYAIHLGASAEVSPGVNTELTYSFRDMGKFKNPKGVTGTTPHLKGHHVAVGVRFDI